MWILFLNISFVFHNLWWTVAIWHLLSVFFFHGTIFICWTAVMCVTLFWGHYLLCQYYTVALKGLWKYVKKIAFFENACPFCICVVILICKMQIWHWTQFYRPNLFYYNSIMLFVLSLSTICFGENRLSNYSYAVLYLTQLTSISWSMLRRTT